MATERIANDSYHPAPTQDDLREAARIDNELQPDLELAEGPASGLRIAVFAIAMALVVGTVFYGLNSPNSEQASAPPATAPTSTASTSTAENSPQPPAPPPAAANTAPHANMQPGVTTGAAPASPQTPPSAAPTGQDASRPGAPATNGAQTK